MGASKKLAAANALKAQVIAGQSFKTNPDALNGLYAVGGSIASIFTKNMDDAKIEGHAKDLLALLNQIEASEPRPEFREVVLGAMRAIGFEPVK